MAGSGLENETGLRAVDAHLLHFRIREMLRERTKWSDRCEDSPPELLRLFVSRSRQARTLLLADYSPNELVDPTLVVHAQARAVAARELGRKFGLHERPDTSFGGWCRDGGYDHEDLFLFPYRPDAMAIASSGLEMGASVAYAAPGSATTAATCLVAAAKTKAAASLAGTATTKPPETAPCTSPPSANGTTVGGSP